MVKNTNRVKELREKNAWSIAELARQSNLSYQTVSKIEKGLKTSRISQLKIAKSFNLDHSKIF